MSANSFGQRFVTTTFGESHGPALGAVIDGCPAGVPFDLALLRHELERRRPGTRSPGPAGVSITSARAEPDEPEVLSGVYEGLTLGTPIAILIRNQDARPQDYAALKSTARTGHADDVWRAKFGHSDPRGGGRSSGRETAARVMAGAVAQMFLRRVFPALRVVGFARQIGPFELSAAQLAALWNSPISELAIDSFPARYPSAEQAPALTELLAAAKREGKSYGGSVELWIDGAPANLGQPVFHKLKADLAQAMLSVGATIGCELGDGIDAAYAEGSTFHRDDARPQRYGGIRGGISTGERIILRVAFKPTATVLEVARAGRHDPCIVPRAIPVLESMLYLVLADHVLWTHGDRLPPA